MSEPFRNIMASILAFFKCHTAWMFISEAMFKTESFRPP
uniref:Uncharacterized protein n=1 Tax=Anguilla anguilla TaxID=7936 RepID=A0A0E9XAQ5_ANGAN